MLQPVDQAGRRSRKQTPEQIIRRLSEQSVKKHFDAYEDIDWDDAKNAIRTDDPRWEKGPGDPLGRTSWYQAQSQEVRSRLGLHMIAVQMRRGLEFESVLKRGLLEFAMTIDGRSPDFRYAYHEVIEEAQHSLMFQEFVNRTGLHVEPLPASMQMTTRQIAALGRRFPELFFMFVLGGEEPIDHVQREALRSDGELHPLLERIIRIHVTEEARHLCFARLYLEREVPRLSRLQMTKLRTATPVILGQMAGLMLEPPRQLVEEYGIPEDVVKRAYRNNAEHKRAVNASLAKVRELSWRLGILTKQWMGWWRAAGIQPEAD